ncbi:MAG: beta-propeller fold lactonase family protein [Deltaproteobacteria bacterium]|nr:beta-propeller fold lactonase family protein [Deltaproteobacteria bacterium]
MKLRAFGASGMVLGLFGLLASCGSDDASTNPVSTGGSAGAAGAAGQAGSADGGLTPQGLMDTLYAVRSCALMCDPECEEKTKAYDCPTMHPWNELPHETDPAKCGTWDGTTYPTPVAGKCTASDATGDATAKTTVSGNPVILPDGRRVKPAGHWKAFLDTDLEGTFPFSALWVPGTGYVIVSDDGYDDHALRVIDTAKLAADQDPTVSYVKFPSPSGLNYGLALAPDGTVYAASEKTASAVLAFSFDKATGKLTRNEAKDVKLENAAAGDTFPMGIDVSSDGKYVIAAQVKQNTALVYSLESATYGEKIGAFAVGDSDQFAAMFDPAHPDIAYVTVWNKHVVVEINLATKKTRTFATGREPEEMVILDDSYMAVAESLGDQVAIIDRAAGTVASTIPIDPSITQHGTSPTTLAYDKANQRLYATLATINGVAVWDVTPSTGPGSPPTFQSAGFLPTLWWPTDVVVAGPTEPNPGSLVIISGKGVGGGPVTDDNGPGIGRQMHGGVQYLPFPDASMLATQTAVFEETRSVQKLAGNSEVTCPGADYDFPIPKTNTEGPSKQIDHIIYIVRENKTYDAVMGDIAGADGDPNLVLIPGKMEEAFGNTRQIAKSFSHGDNFYHDAEQSIQGHYWTVFGRTSDYTERTWLSTWGRGTRAEGSFPFQGVIDATWPMEGGIFSWLKANNISFDNMGENLNLISRDKSYGQLGIVDPGKTRPDTQDACYVAGRARVLCDLKTFTYTWLVNDHTLGGEPGKPNPGLMISVNDEATGMIVDALSHSPLWKSSLVVVIEDDPQTGRDHVDTHRSIMVMASPWVRRGYVSHGHYDPASLHKLFSHILGLPYNNDMVANAAVPFDLFTSTPDYTPFTYKPRTWTDMSCNPTSGATAVEAQAWHWDWDEVDDQPGLSEQIWSMFHPK